jgi:hypothetical protein
MKPAVEQVPESWLQAGAGLSIGVVRARALPAQPVLGEASQGAVEAPSDV